MFTLPSWRSPVGIWVVGKPRSKGLSSFTVLRPLFDAFTDTRRFSKSSLENSDPLVAVSTTLSPINIAMTFDIVGRFEGVLWTHNSPMLITRLISSSMLFSLSFVSTRSNNLPSSCNFHAYTTTTKTLGFQIYVPNEEYEPNQKASQLWSWFQCIYGGWKSVVCTHSIR